MPRLRARAESPDSATRAVSLQAAATPHEIPGWDQLAQGHSFYVAADWLRYADTDRVATSRYMGLSGGGRLLAALSSHWAPHEVDPDYVATRTLDLPGTPTIETGVLTLGGRRGFLSGVLIAEDSLRSSAAGHLADLIGVATRSAPGGNGPWWWPYLPASDVDVVLAAGHLLTSRCGLGIHLVGADCVIDVVGTSIDDHIAALPARQRRTNFRRDQKRFDNSGLEIRRVSLSEYWPQLGKLLAAVQRKYGHQQSADELSARLRSQGEHLESRAVVFGCFQGDVVVGFALAYRWGDELALRVVGFDYDRLLGADEYAQLAVHAPLRYCYEQGLRRLHLGTESYEAKCRRGARPRPLWAVTSLPGSHPDGHLRRARRIVAPMPAQESANFIAYVNDESRRWAAFLSS